MAYFRNFDENMESNHNMSEKDGEAGADGAYGSTGIRDSFKEKDIDQKTLGLYQSEEEPSDAGRQQSDTSGREFMRVDSFSQLPFMRSREKPPNSSIRLFGRDFPPEASRATTTADPLAMVAVKVKPGSTSPAASATAGDRRRKFECQYCFRNFPTSQALGGHQNAHKRERQHAKRSQLQAALAAESHLHGVLSRGGIPMPPATGFAFDQSPQPHYPSWNLSAGAGRGGRFYGGIGSVRQPIYGGQMPAGVWRPPVVHDYHQNHFTVADPLPLVLYNGKERKETAVKGVGSSTSSSTLTSPRERHGYDSKDVVSLDLHL